MGAAVGEGRVDDAHRVGPCLLFGVGQHFAHIIGVAKRDVAFARPDRLDLRAVVALGLFREVGLQPFGPGLRRLKPVMDDHRGGQAEVVVMRAGAGADAALPFRVGQRLICRNLAIGDALLAGIDDAGAGGETEPLVAGVAEFGRDVGGEDVGGDGPRHARLDDLRQPRDIDGQDHVGGAAVALVLKPFDHALVDMGDVDGDPGLRGERIDEGLDQLRLAEGIDVDLIGEGGGGEGGHGHRQGKGAQRHVPVLRVGKTAPLLPPLPGQVKSSRQKLSDIIRRPSPRVLRAWRHPRARPFPPACCPRAGAPVRPTRPRPIRSGA